jgi:FtsH-binding integral membrane protein
MPGKLRRGERTEAMSDAMGLRDARATTRDRSLTLFGQTMAYVAATAGFFALGAYVGRDLSESLGWVWFIAAIVCLFAMNFTARRSIPVTSLLLGAFGFLIRLATAPLLVYYAATEPAVLWEAGGATALFIAGFGTAGYLVRRDLTVLARVAFFALLALIIFGIVLIFVHIPQGTLIYAVLGLVIFAALTMFDFQRLRRSKDISSAPLIAASIFLDILNVFLFFLRIFGSN